MNYSILIYCRAGFENEAASEIVDIADKLQIKGYIKAKLNTSFILFIPYNQSDIFNLWNEINIHNVIFARQILFCFSYLNNLPENNRIAPILEECKIINKLIKENTIKSVFVEVPDTNEHKELLNFCKKFTTPLEIQLEKHEILKPHLSRSDHNLHLLFLESKSCYLALSNTKNSSPYFMGIPRLKFPSKAPSRSTLKLEEAFLFFLNNEQRESCFKNGAHAVDLGASPGGWTYQFVIRNILVTAVDNANMDKNLMQTGLVTHIKMDGFKFIPAKPVQWLVCDMVEKPSRIIKLILRWAANKYATHYIFNLKLPMKKRFEEVKAGLNLLRTELNNSKLNYILECKQLYHDREEVTVWLKLN